MTPIDIIRRFIDLTPEQEARINDGIRHRHFAKGETITGLKTLELNAYFIQSGSARLYFTLRGKEHTVAFFFANQFAVVSRELLSRNPDTTSLQFMEQSDVVFMSHVDVKNIVGESPRPLDMGSMLFFNTALIERLKVLEERLYVLQTCSAAERYRWALEKYPRLAHCATTTQIASFLGLTKETLYRIKGNKYAPTLRPPKALSKGKGT